MNPLERILKYNLSEEEANAYKLSLLWEKLVCKFLPEEQYKMTGSRQDYSGGDPRKTYLFKLCWKLQRETRGILKPDDYKYYLYAQIDILKRISDSNKHAFIDNSVIVGPKAWKRWKLWQHHFNKRIANNREAPPISEMQTMQELKTIKEFLIRTFGRTPIEQDYSSELLKTWLDKGTVTPTYLLLSPYVQKLTNNTFSYLGFDPKLYENRLTGVIHDFFQKEFSYEFETI